jgi:hypothetical protein
VGARGVALAWGAPRGDHSDYQLQYLAGGTLHAHDSPAPRYNLTGLLPYTSYTFTVVVSAPSFTIFKLSLLDDHSFTFY